MKYKEVVDFRADAVRALCIRYNWYTAGSGEAYQRMLDKVDEEPFSLELLEWVAEDIIEHTPTDHDDFEEYEDAMPLVLFELNRHCCYRFYRKED